MRSLPFYRQRSRRKTARLIALIRDEADRFRKLSPAGLRDACSRLRDAASSAPSVIRPNILVPALGLATESLRRVSGKQYYDVQLWGGIELANGAIAEIQTGEGKTLITALPAVVHALAGKGVHVATTSDYLSRRDFEELRPVYRTLGLSVGHIEAGMDPAEKRSAYGCDITYGPGYEFGFDYLRDQIALRHRQDLPLGSHYLNSLKSTSRLPSQLIQRKCSFAIIDEVDSVLIDEANTPLVLSGPSNAPTTCSQVYLYSREIANGLRQDIDFVVDETKSRVTLTASGTDTIARAYQDRPNGSLARSFRTMIEQALHAEHVLRCNVHYVIRDEAIQIVDPHTGRIHDERQWRSGLHQAVEVKEGIAPSTENEIDARITRQRYCNTYDSICGLTGTAAGNESDFARFYGKAVFVVPPNRTCLRTRIPDRFFASEADKFAFTINDTMRRSAGSQPVLIGTRSIDASQRLASAMRDAGVSTFVLNGLQDEEEADIVSGAGAPGRVTIATNMAGRGTDIHLSETARSVGGLHVIATEFQESTRVDRQFAGRAARQGDPGSCQFMASPNDTLLTNHGTGIAAKLTQITVPDGITNQTISNRIRSLQQSIERERFEKRCQMVSRDDWLESIQSSLARTG